MTHEKKGSLYAILSGLCYGLVGYFGIQIMHAHLSVFNMLFWRFLTASVLVGILVVCSRQKISCSLREALTVFSYGALLYSASTVSYFFASMYIGTGLAMVIFFTYPAVIMLLNRLLYKKPIPKIYYAAISLIIIGLLLLTDIRDICCDISGIGIGMSSAFFYALYVLSCKKNTLPPLISTGMVSFGCCVTLGILSLINHSFVVPSTLHIWGNIIGMGVICTAVPILLLLEGLKYISEEKASILSVLEPVFVVIVGVLLLDETIHALQALGIITILSGAIITLLYGKKA